MTRQKTPDKSHSQLESAATEHIKESRLMKGIQFKRLALFALLIAVFAAIGAQAQLTTASLSGSITDPSGAVVPNAKITLTQTDTNFVRVASSKADGSFHEEFLPVGPYKVSVALAGFKTLQRSGIVLSVMQNATQIGRAHV